jgi:hypothetical protein
MKNGKGMMKKRAVKMGRIMGLVCLATGIFYSCGNQFIDTFASDTERYKVDFAPQDDGTVRFFTNRSEDMPSNFEDSEWYYRLGAGEYDWTAGEFAVEVEKKTGAPDGFFGVVFSAKKEDGQLTGWFVVINTTREYCHGTIKKDDVTVNGPFNCGDLAQGQESNTISVSYDGESDAYSVFFNGNPEPATTFAADDDIVPAGRLGYIAEVLGNEDFPAYPVDVSFTQVTPADIGMGE